MLTLAWHAHEVIPDAVVARARSLSHWRSHNSREHPVMLLLDEQRLDPAAAWFARQMTRPRGAALCGLDGEGRRWPVTTPRYDAAEAPDPTRWLNDWIGELQWGRPTRTVAISYGRDRTLNLVIEARPPLARLRVERWGIAGCEEAPL